MGFAQFPCINGRDAGLKFVRYDRFVGRYKSDPRFGLVVQRAGVLNSADAPARHAEAGH
jgi:hypothetical protein